MSAPETRLEVGVSTSASLPALNLGVDADVTITDDEQVVSGLARQAAKLVHLIVGSETIEPNQEANGQLREVPDQLTDDWNRGILFVQMLPTGERTPPSSLR